MSTTYDKELVLQEALIVALRAADKYANVVVREADAKAAMALVKIAKQMSDTPVTYLRV